MNTELPRRIASYTKRGTGLHTSLLVVYHSLGVYVHHKQTWENTTPGRESSAFKADGCSMFSLIPCGGVGTMSLCTSSPVVPSGHPPDDR